MGTIWKSISLLLLAALLISGCKLRSATENLAGVYPVQPGGKLFMRLNQGTVDLQTADHIQAATIHVSRKITSLHGDPKTALENEKIDISTTGNELHITCQRADGPLNHIHLGDVIDTYVIQIPRQFSVDIDSGCGGIRVGAIQGNVTISSAGDGVAVDQVQGAADLKCSGGDIKAREITGPLTAKSAGGDIDIGSALGGLEAKSSGGNIKAALIQKNAVLKTAGGDIDITSLQGGLQAGTAGGNIHVTFQNSPPVNCEMKTAGGDIRVFLPPNASAILDAETSAGDVTTDFPISVEGRLESSQLQGKIGAGGPTLRLRTSGGDIKILQKK